MQVIVNGLATHYEDEGKGDAVLLLHGWGDNGAGLLAVRKQLAITHRVITPDLPGFGGTAAPPSAWNLSDYAAFVRDFLAKIKMTEVALIIGHSNGGAIAIRGLSSGSLRTKKLILLASAGVRGETSGYQQRLQVVTKVGKLASHILPRAAQRKLRQQLYERVGSDALVAEHLNETFKRIVADDVRADAANVTVPTLLLYGEQDTATPPRYGELLSERIKHSKLVVVPRAGHFVHIDATETVMKSIEEFMA